MVRQIPRFSHPESEKEQLHLDSHRFLIFRLGTEQFGIAVLSVREVIRARSATPIPHAPDYLSGIINLRGKTVPVIDLRKRFGLPPALSDERCCIVVVDAHGSNGVFAAGITVDEVLEVTSISANEIEPAPNFDDRVKRSEITGIAKNESEIRILLDPDEVLCVRLWQSRGLPAG